MTEERVNPQSVLDEIYWDSTKPQYAPVKYPGFISAGLAWPPQGGSGQYIVTGQPGGGLHRRGIRWMLQQAQKRSDKAYWEYRPTVWPSGTATGVKKSSSSEISLKPLDAAAAVIFPSRITAGLDESFLKPENIRDIAPYGFYWVSGVVGILGLWGDFAILGPDDTNGIHFGPYLAWGGAIFCNWYNFRYTNMGGAVYHPVGQYSPWDLTVQIAVKTSADMPNPFLGKVPGNYYTLYHVIKQNAEIEPAHGTKLLAGGYYRVKAIPEADRTLTLFTIDGVDRLADSMIVHEDDDIPASLGYPVRPANEGWIDIGPITADVYVSAIAEGVEVEETVKAGIPQTIQMTTDDCLVEAGSWELGDTDLPETVTKSISDLGLVSLYFPQDVYDGNPGGTYYLDVTFNGYSQTKSIKLLITLEDSPAYGTVWEALGLMDEAVNGIFKASSGVWYITGVTKIWKTTDFETFEECTLTGTVTSALSQVAEISGNRLICSDKSNIWITAAGEDTFVEQATWTISNGLSIAAKVSGDPSSNYIWHTCQRTGGDTLVQLRDDTGTLLDSLQINMGIHGLSPQPPVLLDDGAWLVSLPGASKYRVYRYVGGDFVSVADGTGSTTTLNMVIEDSAERITLFGRKALGSIFTRYSTDHGATWSDEATTISASSADVYALETLKPGYAVWGVGAKIGRTADAFATGAEVATLDGTVKCIVQNSYDRTILAGTTGTTTNLWISRS